MDTHLLFLPDVWEWSEIRITSIHLAVMETQDTAKRLYERHGFTVWGTQPDAVRHGGKTYSEHWMWREVGQAER